MSESAQPHWRSPTKSQIKPQLLRNAAALTDANVAAILAQLDVVQTVRLGHPTTTGGVGYLVSVGLMTQTEADAVLHYEIPSAP